MSLPDAIFELKMRKNVFAAGALPLTPLGEFTPLPTHPSWIDGGTQNGPGVESNPPPSKKAVYERVIII